MKDSPIDKFPGEESEYINFFLLLLMTYEKVVYLPKEDNTELGLLPFKLL
jgi:hypothetical protein